MPFMFMLRVIRHAYLLFRRYAIFRRYASHAAAFIIDGNK